jgi:hypothetical protein
MASLPSGTARRDPATGECEYEREASNDCYLEPDRRQHRRLRPDVHRPEVDRWADAGAPRIHRTLRCVSGRADYFAWQKKRPGAIN